MEKRFNKPLQDCRSQGAGGQGDLGSQFWQISLNKEVADYAINSGPSSRIFRPSYGPALLGNDNNQL